MVKRRTFLQPFLVLWMILLILPTFYVTCQAEDTAPIKLTVADAVARALGINMKIKQAEVTQLSSLSNLKIAELTTSYGVGTTTGLNRNHYDSGFSTRAYGNLTYESPTGTQASLDLTPFGSGDDRSSIGITLRKPLLSGSGPLSNKAVMIAGARSDATIQEKQLYLTRQTTVLGVVEAYFNAVLAREQVKVQEHALKIAEESAEAARKRADAELIRGLDVSRAELQVARTRDQLNLQRQAARAAMDRLMSAIGEGVGEEPELVDDVPEPPTDLPGLAEAVRIALTNRTEFAIFDEQLADQTRRVEITEDQLRPKLDVVAGFNSSNTKSGIISHSLIDMGNFTAGLEYRIPLDKRIAVENKKIADRNLDILEKLRTYQMEQVTQQIRDAYRRLEASRISLDILSSNLKVAEDNLRIAQRMVEEDIEDNLVVLNAQDSLTQVQSGLLSAKVDLFLAAINLKYAMGQDLTYMGSK